MNGHEAEIRLMKKGGYPRGIIRLKGWANDIVPRGFGLKKNGRSFFFFFPRGVGCQMRSGKRAVGYPVFENGVRVFTIGKLRQVLLRVTY